MGLLHPPKRCFTKSGFRKGKNAFIWGPSSRPVNATLNGWYKALPLYPVRCLMSSVHCVHVCFVQGRGGRQDRAVRKKASSSGAVAWLSNGPSQICCHTQTSRRCAILPRIISQKSSSLAKNPSQDLADTTPIWGPSPNPPLLTHSASPSATAPLHANPAPSQTPIA